MFYVTSLSFTTERFFKTLKTKNKKDFKRFLGEFVLEMYRLFELFLVRSFFGGLRVGLEVGFLVEMRKK